MRRILLVPGLLLALVLLASVACRAAAPSPTPTQPPATPTATRAPATPTPTTAVVQPTATPTTAIVQPTATATAAPTAAGTPIDTLVAQAKARGKGALNPWVSEQITKRNIPGRRPPLPTTPPKYGGAGGGGGLPTISAFPTGVQTLDPFINVQISDGAIHDKLLDKGTGPQYAPISSVVNPMQAQSWEYKDNTTLVLHLTKTAKFWNKPPVNGRPITAQDWVWTFEKLRASPGAAAVAARFQPVSSFKALDDYTLELKTTRPYATLLLQLASNGFGVMPKEIYETGKAIATEADLVASGPWILEKFTPGSELVMKRNPDYWGYWSGAKDNLIVETPTQYKLPFMDGVVWLQLTDEAAMDAGFRAQKIDMLGWQRSIKKPRYDSLSSTNPNATWTIFIDTANRRPWLFRVDEPPFDNIKLRQAVSAALDQEGMCTGPQAGWCIPGEYVYAGGGEWFLPNFEYGEGAKYSGNNPELAKKLLAEAGYKGEPINFETAPWVPYTVAEGELFQANLKSVGMNVNINSRDVNAHISVAFSGNWHGVLQTFFSSGVDPDEWLRTPYHSKTSGGTVLHLNDAKLDAMLDAESAELDHWARVAKVYEIIRYLAVQRYSTYAAGGFANASVAQPYMKNFSFTGGLVGWGWGTLRAWVDKDNPNVGFQPL